MEHQKILDDWNGKRYQERPKFGYQCVAWVKKYYELRYGITGLSFGGSAINAWNGKGNLDQLFDRVEVAQEGDIAFFHDTLTNPSGHTGLYHTIKLLSEQNGGKGTGTGLGVDAIRLGKYPTNIAGYMRLKSINHPPMEKHLLQFGEKDCSLTSTMNCICLNNTELAKVFTQELVNELMPNYYNKHPRDAFQFLKDRGYDVKIMPLTFAQAKIRMKKGSAVLLFIKGATPQSSHWTCMKQVNGKYLLYDSTRPDVVEIPDIDTPYNNGVFTDLCFQSR